MAAGIASIFAAAGLIFRAVMSVVQAIWILTAWIALAVLAPPARL